MNSEKEIGEANIQLRQASGEVNFPLSEWLTGFLYSLMTHGLSVGDLESVIRNDVKLIEENVNNPNFEIRYSNGYLAQYAKFCSDRLLKAVSLVKIENHE